MTRKEKQMLRDLIKNLIKHNRNAWWQLKREIYESGYQGYYPALDDFDEPARTMISSLPIEEKNALLQEWQQAKPERPDHPAERVLERSEEHTSELQSRPHLVCRLLLEKKKKRRK